MAKGRKRGSMKNQTTRVTTIVLALTLCLIVGYLAIAQSGEEIPYPAGFRQWVHLKSTIVGTSAGAFEKEPCVKPCVGGIFHFYANDKALEGYRTGKFPEGSIIADEFLERHEVPNNADASYESTRRGVGMMVKDSQRFAATGGWGYETFKGDSHTEGRATPKEAKACYTCHIPRKDHDYTFITYHE
jgi:hypothetical protein